MVNWPTTIHNWKEFVHGFSQFSAETGAYGFAATWAQVLSSTSGISSAEFHFRDRPMQAVNGKGVPTS